MQRSWILLFLCIFAAACDPNSSRTFTSGRSQNPCTETIPACAETSADCTIDDSQYIEQRFPGDISFLVQCRAEDEIKVELFIKDVVDVGQQTIIYWNEPGCSDYYQWDSAGRDFVSESRDTNVFSQIKQMHEPGEHLIEVFSDLNGTLLIGVTVIAQGSQ
jgi:hypothetical protein